MPDTQAFIQQPSVVQEEQSTTELESSKKNGEVLSQGNHVPRV
jgi:hypothetical protein